MKTFPLLGLVALGALTSCDALNNLNPMGGGGQAALDQAKATPVMNQMRLPPGAAVGTWWEMSMGGMKTKHCIVAEKDGQFIIEQAKDGSTVVTAIQVDPSVDLNHVPKPGELMPANVTAAWVGLEGEAPIEVKVMDPMKMPEPTGGSAPAVEFEEGTETVSLGGKDWNAKWMTSGDSKTWSVDGFPLKSDYQGKTSMELAGFGTDAKPMLDWDKK